MIGWMSSTATRNPFHSAAQKADAERDQQDDEVRIAGVNAPGDGGADHRDHRADRKVDALGPDHHRHAERDQRRRHGAIEDVDQAAEQAAFDDADGEEAGRDEAVDDQDHRQRQAAATPPGGRAAARSRTPRPFVAAIVEDCSVVIRRQSCE